MKRHGKLLLLVLAMILSTLMIVSASGLEIFIIASTEEYESYGTSARYLEVIDVMQGYGDGDLHLEEPILRYQAALFFARVVTGVTDDTAWGTGPSATYSDVPEYGPVIDMISSMDIIRGYGNGKFGYNDGIRYQDMCAMLIRVLGYETEEMAASYPLSYIFEVEKLGLALENVKPADYLNRGQTARMIYDALVTDIADTTDEKVLTLEKVVEALLGNNAVNATKETYLERNFDVSSTMQFEIVATENYKMDGYDFAEEGYFEAELLVVDDDGYVHYSDEVWAFPIEGTPTTDVPEAALIGKCLDIVFDEKNPTSDMLADEECEVIHADIVEGVVYENLGELSHVAFDEDMEKLTLGPKTVKVSDLDYYAFIWQYSDDASKVTDSLTVQELAEAMENNTYFSLECFDYNKDGYYDTVIYTPYSFGQYAKRTYSGKDYVMLGQYYPTAVYDTSKTAEKTDDNKTYFVEYFLGEDTTVAAVASKSYAKYTPGDTSLKVNESVSELSMTATVTGEEIRTGDFMLYSYNELTNTLDVVENLGTYQLGTVTGYKTRNQTYVLDGSEMSVGMPGNQVAENGLLVGDGAFAEVYEDVRNMVANYEKGNYNAKYLEYDGKIIYLESYGGSDNVVGSDWVIIDADETLEKYKDSLKDEEDAWDVPFEGTNALLEKLDPATGDFETIRVEKVAVLVEGTATEYTFKNIAERYEIGSWTDNKLYNALSQNGVLYAIEDDDQDGFYEIYARGTENFNVLGAKPVYVSGSTEPTVSFSYNKSNEFIAENSVGILTQRLNTNANTVSVIIGQDGYTVVKGALGTDSVTPNGLWLSESAMILEATDDQLTIFDPVGYIDVAAASNHLYHNNEDSIWHTGDGARTDDGVAYYMMVEASSYVDSYVMENSDGSIAENEDGDRLYAHEYKGLYNLLTGTRENVTLVTTSLDAPATEVVNSITGVIKYNAEKYEADLTTFGEVFVANGDYHYGGFAWLAAKDRISFAVQPKDRNGDGDTNDKNEQGTSFYANTDEDKVYNSLSSLKVTFIDLDAGADVDPDEHSFTDAYVFYRDDESNRKSYAAVELEDRKQGIGYPAGTYPIKRHIISAKDVSGNIGNGRITELTAGKEGLIASQAFFRWNGWSDYLIPPVNEDGDTVWTYEGSIRIAVTYYAYINFDEEEKTCEAVVIRVGENMGVVGANDSIPAAKDEPTDPEVNYTEE